MNFLFFLNSVLFGISLAMDAFSVSLANGMHDPDMRVGRQVTVAGTFALFQIVMPLIGWFCVRTVEEQLTATQAWIPWIALGLLLFLGIRMLREGWQERREAQFGGPDKKENPGNNTGVGTLLVQGVATSIDALSVGFTIADATPVAAVTEALIIGAVTFGICLAGLWLGRKIGTRLAWKASMLGGVILIGIGLEIFLSGIL